MESTREKAKEYRKSKEFSKAIKLYKELWDIRQERFDMWLGWEYAYCLKQTGNIEQAIKVCKETYLKYRDFNYNKLLLCWCIYEKYINNIDNIDKKNIEQYLERANFIINNTVQDENKTPYENTVFKVVEVYRKQIKIDYEGMLEWLNKLDYMKLSDTHFKLNIKGREKEIMSKKERYLFLKTKCLEKLERYEECIAQIKQVNVDSIRLGEWICVREYTCRCKVNKDNREEFTRSINELVHIAEKTGNWAIYNKLVECYVIDRDYNNALLYGSKALVTKEPISKKVNLIHIMGEVYEKINDFDNAKNHFRYEASIRKKAGWAITYSLEKKLREYNIDDYIEMKEKSLREEWIKNIYSFCEVYKGSISKMQESRKSGFILSENGKSYYFNTRSIIQGKCVCNKGSKVIFCLKDSYDKKKNVRTKEAIEITIQADKNKKD